MRKIYLEVQGKAENGSLIECIPDIIKDIVVNEIGIKKDEQGNELLDISSFHNCKLNRNEIKGAFSLNEIKSNRLIEELLKNSDSMIVVDSMNKLKIIPIEITSVIYYLDESDIAMNEYGCPDIRESKQELSYNSFRMFYRVDYETNKYLKSEYITPDSTSLSEIENSKNGNINYYTGLCASSMALTGKKIEFAIESDYIRDRNSAVSILKRITEKLSFKKISLFIRTIINSKTLRIEPGDCIKVSIANNRFIENNYITVNTSFDYLNKYLIIALHEVK